MTRTWAQAVLSACVVAFLGMPQGALADSLEEIFARGNAAYFRSDFETAAAEYRQLIELGVVDPDVSFNLATAEARLGHYGAAIQYYEHALWLRPGDDDARAGLDAARSAVGQRRASEQGEAEIDTSPPVTEALFGGFSTNTLAFATLTFDGILFLALLGWLFVKRDSHRLACGIIAPIAGLLGIVAGTGLVTASGWLDDGTPAVVLAEGATVYDGPDTRSTARGRGLEGQRAFVLGEDGDFVEVQLSDGPRGWMREGDVGLTR